MKSIVKWATRNVIFLVLIAFIIIFGIVTKVFFTVNNLTNIVRQIATTGIAAAGMTMIMLTGGIDLTPGSTVSLVGVTCALLMTKTNVPITLVVIIGVLIGITVGIINGVLIAYAKMPPLICTLAMMHGLRGLCYILTEGMPVYGFPASFGKIGKGYLGFLPIPVIIMAVVMILMGIMLTKTRLGRHVYAIGGNREALRLSGVNVKKRIVTVYSLAGILFGLAGVVLLARVGSAQPSAGSGFEFDIITAVVLGGISVSGGEGRLFDAFAGVLVMGVLSNGMTLLNVYEYYQMIMKCVVLLIAVFAGEYIKTRQVKHKI